MTDRAKTRPYDKFKRTAHRILKLLKFIIINNKQAASHQRLINDNVFLEEIKNAEKINQEINSSLQDPALDSRFSKAISEENSLICDEMGPHSDANIETKII